MKLTTTKRWYLRGESYIPLSHRVKHDSLPRSIKSIVHFFMQLRLPFSSVCSHGKMNLNRTPEAAWQTKQYTDTIHKRVRSDIRCLTKYHSFVEIPRTSMYYPPQAFLRNQKINRHKNLHCAYRLAHNKTY